MKHVTIGIDPSINSTGICVSGDGFNKYFIISSKVTQKTLKWVERVDWLDIKLYEKIPTTDIKDYHTKESTKFQNLISLITEFSSILSSIQKCYVIDMVVMEGVSYGSVSGAALVDLSFLNAMMRMKMNEMGIKFYIVAPTEIKKFAVGNGSAEKGMMIMSWKKLDKNTQSIPDYVKCDDLADAFFMAHYES